MTGEGRARWLLSRERPMGGIIESDPDFNRYTFDIGKRGSDIYIASAAAAMSNTRKKQEAPTSSDDDDDGDFSRERENGAYAPGSLETAS